MIPATMAMKARRRNSQNLARPSFPLILALFLLSLLANQKGAFCKTLRSVTVKPFGTSEGQQVDMYTLSWGRVSADILTFGATLRALRYPDRYGVIDDVVTGFDTLAPYLTKNFRFGCIKGRVGTVLTGNKVSIGNQSYNITGGGNTFCYKVFKATPITTPKAIGLKLELTSPSGEDGHPGTLTVTATYLLTIKKKTPMLTLNMRATTDSPTYVNLIHHPYFNLGGHAPANLTTTGLANEIKFNADRYTPGLNATNTLPNGMIVEVSGTPFDLRKWTPVGKAVDRLISKSPAAPGFDDFFILVDGYRLAGQFRYPPTGRALAVYTNQPGFIFFTGHRLNTVGKGGVPYTKFSFHAFETAQYRDAPNKPNFPSILLLPGKIYKHDIAYILSTFK